MRLCWRVVYPRFTQFSERIYKILYKDTSLILFSKGPTVVVVWEIDGETYLRERNSSHIFFREPGGVPTLTPSCKLVRDASDRLRVPRSTAILCTLSKTDRMVLITWSPSGYTPARPECPDAPSSSCLQIKMWQLTKAHGITRNEPKIHAICYITDVHGKFSILNMVNVLISVGLTCFL